MKSKRFEVKMKKHFKLNYRQKITSIGGLFPTIQNNRKLKRLPLCRGSNLKNCHIYTENPSLHLYYRQKKKSDGRTVFSELCLKQYLCQIFRSLILEKHLSPPAQSHTLACKVYLWILAAWLMFSMHAHDMLQILVSHQKRQKKEKEKAASEAETRNVTALPPTLAEMCFHGNRSYICILCRRQMQRGWSERVRCGEMLSFIISNILWQRLLTPDIKKSDADDE